MTTATKTRKCAESVKAQIENFNSDLIKSDVKGDIAKAETKINRILKKVTGKAFNFEAFRNLHDPMQYKASEVEAILLNEVLAKVQQHGFLFLDDLLTDAQYEALESLTGSWARMAWSEDRKTWKALASKAYA
jgi:hypothetical protein